MSQNGAGRIARRIAALNHSLLSVLSGGLLLLCGGDWEPLLAPLLCWLHGQAGPLSPGGVASAGLVTVLAGSFAVSVGSTWTGTGAGAVYDVARHLRYHGAQQLPSPQSPSAASPCLLLATSDAALTP